MGRRNLWGCSVDGLGKSEGPYLFKIDWHSHLLPNLDDGSGSLEESLAIARQLVDCGFKEVYCTPHCLPGLYANGADSVRRAVFELQHELSVENISLKIHAGMEYYIDEFFPAQWPEILPLGETKYLLVETSPHAEPDKIKEALFEIRRQGFTPLLAHPERYPCLFLPPKKKSGNSWIRYFSGRRTDMPCKPQMQPLVNDLLNMGCLFQGNLGSFAGIYGSEVKAQAFLLLEAGAYFCYGSDAHRAKNLARIVGRGLENIRTAQPG